MGTTENIQGWSTTASSNATSDAGVGTLADSMSPDAVDNSERSIMAAIKKYVLDVSGAPAAVGGTANAITITTNQAISSGHQAAGFRICFKAASTNTSTVTVAVDGLSAADIEDAYGRALTAGMIVSGGIYDLAYNATNSGYTLLNPSGGGSRAASFSVHKNGSDQTGVTTGTPIKVTFGTELFDIGSYFASSTWTPPAGTAIISAGVRFSTAGASLTVAAVMLYKNGAEHKRAYQNSTTIDGIYGTWVVQANGSDTFEIYVQHNLGSNETISGTATETWAMGSMI